MLSTINIRNHWKYVLDISIALRMQKILCLFYYCLMSDEKIALITILHMETKKKVKRCVCQAIIFTSKNIYNDESLINRLPTLQSVRPINIRRAHKEPNHIIGF